MSSSRPCLEIISSSCWVERTLCTNNVPRMCSGSEIYRLYWTGNEKWLLAYVARIDNGNLLHIYYNINNNKSAAGGKKKKKRERGKKQEPVVNNWEKQLGEAVSLMRKQTRGDQTARGVCSLSYTSDRPNLPAVSKTRRFRLAEMMKSETARRGTLCPEASLILNNTVLD